MSARLATLLILTGVLVASEPVRAEGDSFPLPTYDKGDVFTFNTDGTSSIETVLHGAANSYIWRLDNGYTKVTFADPTLPPQRVVDDNKKEVERRVFSRNAQDIFPIHVGKKNDYEAEYFRVGMEVGETETHSCSVVKSFRVRVKAGAFQALEISCQRSSGAEMIYYAPQVGHKVLSFKLDEEGNELSRTELISYARAKPEQMDYSKPTNLSQADLPAENELRSGGSEVIIPNQPLDEEDNFAQPYAKDGPRIKPPEKPDLRKKKPDNSTVAIKQQEGEQIIAPEKAPIPLTPGTTVPQVLPPEQPGGIKRATGGTNDRFTPAASYKSYGVQISSAANKADAERFLSSFWKKHGATFEGLRPSYYQYQGKYRVILDSFDGKAQAFALCRSLKEQRIDCWAYKLPNGVAPAN